MNDEKEQKGPEKEERPEFVWTPESLRDTLRDLEGFIEHLADKYLAYKKTQGELESRYAEALAKHVRRVAYFMVGFLALIILAMGFLTWLDKVSGDALLFLAGTITGYIFGFVRRVLFPEEKIEQEEEP